MKTIGIILGSTRQQRFGDKVAQWVMSEVQHLPDTEAKLLDLRDFTLPFYDEPKPPSALGGIYSNSAATRWAEAIKNVDAVVVVTPEYNHSYPAVLKNAIDYLYAEWHLKPYIIISYSGGAIGGARAGTRLRGLLDYMGLVCKGEINLSFATKVIAADGTLTEASWSERAQTALKKLIS